METTCPVFTLRGVRQIALLVVMFGTLAACGGGLEASVTDLFDGGADSNESSASGGEGGRPGWVNDWVQLPAGAEIESAFNGEGERLVAGVVRSTDADAVTNEFYALLASSGFERLGDSTFFVRDGEPAVQLTLRDTGDTVLFNLELDGNDVQTLRDVYGTGSPESAADAVTTESGSAADAVTTESESDSGNSGAQSVETTLDLVIGDERTSQKGRCTFTSTGITFTNDNSEIIIDNPRSDSPMIYGVVIQPAADGQEFQAWTVASGAQSVNVIGTGFVAEASFTGGVIVVGEPVPGFLTATC